MNLLSHLPLEHPLFVSAATAIAMKTYPALARWSRHVIRRRLGQLVQWSLETADAQYRTTFQSTTPVDATLPPEDRDVGA